MCSAEQPVVKQRFNTMLRRFFSNKALVELLLRYPMCSAEQPEVILKNIALDMQMQVMVLALALVILLIMMLSQRLHPKDSTQKY